MSPTLIALGIDRLSVAEREEEVPVTEAQRLDLECRLAAYEANPKAGSSWEEVKSRLRGNP